MFKKFDGNDDITGGATQLKTSVQRGIRTKLLEQFPHLESHMEQIFPKKENLKTIRCKDHIDLVQAYDGFVYFIKTRDGLFVPTLRLLHKYPFILPHQQVDKGAIKFVLNGSHIMCPGLTSPGAKLLDNVSKGQIVAVMAEGKEHALAVGLMTLSSEEIKKVNKGTGIENIHYLNDGMWHVTSKPIA
ncbi:unnamed protein product, partial [Mesorhabditis belari]|uniref:PUA domain-containing protein n=1 Tax=Mesorhabditis belari TaxID=2138241 RepID=A0AAF3J299_9BILA